MGIETCQNAIERHTKEGSFDVEMLYPVFYCNLGKAYAASGKRKEALEAGAGRPSPTRFSVGR